MKERLEHGQLLPWIKAEFEMSESTADRMMHVAERFGGKLLNLSNLPNLGNFKPATVADLPVKVLYALAGKYGVGRRVLAKALEGTEPPACTRLSLFYKARTRPPPRRP